MNLELDINQVDGERRDGASRYTMCRYQGVRRWEAAYTAGKLDHWWASGPPCDPRTWKANVWHHIQIGMHRNASGVVTHDWVTFDGTYSAWGYTHLSAHFLGWAPGTINTQVQVEGSNKTSGSATMLTFISSPSIAGNHVPTFRIWNVGASIQHLASYLSRRFHGSHGRCSVAMDENNCPQH